MRKRTALVLSFVATLLLVACPSKTPEQMVAEKRAKYVVQLNTWRLVEPPVEEMPMDEGMAGEEGAEAGEAMAVASAAAATEEAAEGEEMGEEIEEGMGEEMMAEEGPRTATIFFDLIVQFTGREPLDGITVDITHADPFEQEKTVARHWIETGDMTKAETRQVSFEREFENYDEGDVFSVSLRSYVPPEEIGEYREFAAAAP